MINATPLATSTMSHSDQAVSSGSQRDLRRRYSYAERPARAPTELMSQIA